MSPATSPLESGKLAFLATVFIFLFFMLFTYTTFGASFTTDDGTAVVHDLQHFQIPMWKNILHILTVFTPSTRPASTLFWRPMYAIFGFNLVPYRIVVHFMLMANIVLAYVLIRRLKGPREAGVLAALIFCYNASTSDIYYDTCTVTDVLCLLFYAITMAIYLGARQEGNPLTLRRAIAVIVLFGLALDSKEYAIAIPAVLAVYELLFRRADFHDQEKAIRLASLLGIMFAMSGLFLKVKLAGMGQNPLYHPHVTAGFVLTNLGEYLRLLLYLPPHSVTPVKACLLIAAFLAIGGVVRSMLAIYGVLFFLATVFPVTVIPPRGGYCAYGAYLGLAFFAASVLSAARTWIVGRIAGGNPNPLLEKRSTVGLFIVSALLLGWAHMGHWNTHNGYFEYFKPPMVKFLDHFRETVPEFPPGARVLIAEDPWGGDWGQMFLLELMYNDPTLWVDRPKNLEKPPDPSTYDLVAIYKPPKVALSPRHLFRMSLRWQLRGTPNDPGRLILSSPAAKGASAHVEFAPQAVRGHENTTVTIPGFANVPVNALYRIVIGKTSTRQLVKNWCTLDAKGACTISAPSLGEMGALVVDWIQPGNQLWIFTRGELTIVD